MDIFGSSANNDNCHTLSLRRYIIIYDSQDINSRYDKQFFIRLPHTERAFVPRKFIDGKTRVLIENIKITMLLTSNNN